MLCFYCATAVQRKLPLGGYVETSFTNTGFSNWQKALHKFSKHEQSACHRAAFDMISKTSKAIDEMLCTSLAKEKADNRKAMLTIISTIRFLARQGLPLRGSYVSSDGCETNSNFLQLLHLRKEDIPVLNTWLQRSQHHFTSPSIQNELLEIMANMILRKFTRSLSGKQFSIMVDETSDISNTEQLVFCLRYVDEDLTTHEEFIGLYDMDSTTAENIVRVIQDILLRLSLQMSSCRGQCYDGAGSMAGCRTGVATTIQQQEPRALYTHCYGHALNLAVQDSVKNNAILRDTLDTVEEMTKLIKRSPKREVIFKKFKNELSVDSPGVRLLCPTRWTVRAAALSSIAENYVTLRNTWYEAKDQSRDSEMRARIGGVAKQMDSFNFFLGVELGRKILNMADNLSSSLQASNMSANEGQSIMKMTILTLQGMRSEECFLLFWERTEKKRQELGVEAPQLPRQRKVPRRLEVGTSIPDAEKSVEDLYRKTYYEVIDFVLHAIRSIFDQKGYRILGRLESLLCDAEVDLNNYDDVLALYKDDFERDRLESQLRILHSKETGGTKLKSLVRYFQTLSPVERQFYDMVMSLTKIILIMPATNAISERSFSTHRRMKTWLRSTMNQKRLNWCMILHIHNDDTN